MRKTLCVLIALFCFQYSRAQEENLFNLQVEARIDYQRDYMDGDLRKDASGFEGKYLNIQADGSLATGLTYSYRQRLNKAHSSQSFWDATDWLYLDYRASKHWSISAGKQVVAIGGMEYDRSPINLYFCSEFWNNIPCYRMGVSATYHFNEGRDKLTAQLCESPFRGEDEDTYAYNLLWAGSHGALSTLYSANLIEYRPGHYLTYLTLGHRITAGQVSLELDFMNRATSHQAYWLKDCSLMAELSYKPSAHVNLFGKLSYDVNNTSHAGDYCVMPGTELTRIGAGVEYFPLAKGDKRLRLHAFGCHTWGRNGNAAGVLQDKQTLLDVGVTWRMNLLSFKK